MEPAHKSPSSPPFLTCEELLATLPPWVSLPPEHKRKAAALAHLGGTEWVVIAGLPITHEPLLARLRELYGRDVELYIPPGFYTDLISVPRLLRPVFSRFGKGLLAALVHDMFYETEIFREFFPDDRGQKECDKWFRVLLEDSGFSAPGLFYTATRLRGHSRFPHPEHVVQRSRALHRYQSGPWRFPPLSSSWERSYEGKIQTIRNALTDTLPF